MTKMLVSDYDQTLNFDDITFWFNLKKIRQFRENKNIFTLSTGRCYKSIMSEVKKHDIPYDYLSCSDGAVLYDSHNQLLFASYIDQDIIKYLEKISVDSQLIRKIEKEWAHGQMTDEAIECFINTTSLANMRQIREYLKTNFPSIDVTNFFRTIYISNSVNNKSLTIEKIKEIEKLADRDIFTIGDYNNDASMIKDYNGFNMLLSSHKAREHSLKTYFTVGQLIDDISNERAKIRIKN